MASIPTVIDAALNQCTQQAAPMRTAYARAHVRPGDLVPCDVIIVHSEWREVADVWRDGDLDAATQTLGEDSPHLPLLREHLDHEDQYVVVRYWVEQPRGEGVADAVRAYRRPELVTVQVPAGVTPYPDLPMYRVPEGKDPGPC